MRNWLKDQYVVLAGASGGIGRELCKLLICKYQAKVIGVGRREEKMLSLTAELGESSPAFSYRLFDVSSKADWQAFKADLEEKNIRPALLINNAGAFPAFAKATDVPSETVEKIMRTNFLRIWRGSAFPPSHWARKIQACHRQYLLFGGSLHDRRHFFLCGKQECDDRI